MSSLILNVVELRCERYGSCTSANGSAAVDCLESKDVTGTGPLGDSSDLSFSAGVSVPSARSAYISSVFVMRLLFWYCWQVLLYTAADLSPFSFFLHRFLDRAHGPCEVNLVIVLISVPQNSQTDLVIPPSQVSSGEMGFWTPHHPVLFYFDFSFAHIFSTCELPSETLFSYSRREYYFSL